MNKFGAKTEIIFYFLISCLEQRGTGNLIYYASDSQDLRVNEVESNASDSQDLGVNEVGSNASNSQDLRVNEVGSKRGITTRLERCTI